MGDIKEPTISPMGCEELKSSNLCNQRPFYGHAPSQSNTHHNAGCLQHLPSVPIPYPMFTAFGARRPFPYTLPCRVLSYRARTAQAPAAPSIAAATSILAGASLGLAVGEG